MTSKHDQNYKMLGLNIAYYRKLKGLTQLELAEKVNISRTHMSNIEAPNMHTSILDSRKRDEDTTSRIAANP